MGRALTRPVVRIIRCDCWDEARLGRISVAQSAFLAAAAGIHETMCVKPKEAEYAALFRPTGATEVGQFEISVH